MNTSTVIALEDRAESLDPLTELLRVGARQLIAQAVETEWQELRAAHAGRLLADGRAGVVRNGYLPERELQTGLGPITVRIPKVRGTTGEPVTFRSARADRESCMTGSGRVFVSNSGGSRRRAWRGRSV